MSCVYPFKIFLRGREAGEALRWILYLSEFQEMVLGIHFCLLYWKLKKKKK